MTASESLHDQFGQWQMRALLVGIAFTLLAIVGAVLITPQSNLRSTGQAPEY